MLALLFAVLTFGASMRSYVEVPVNQPEKLHQVIQERADAFGGGSAPLTIRLTGSGAMRTEGIKLYPGLRIEGEGTWPGQPMIKLIDEADLPLIMYPFELRAGGGGVGVPYPHHTGIFDFTIDGNRDRQREDYEWATIEVYNGGFQNRFEGLSIKNCKNACVRVERTALNFQILNTDFSNCGAAVDADFYNMTAGILEVSNGQVDNCGTHAFIIRFGRDSGLTGSLGLIVFSRLQFEWQTGTPQSAFRIYSDATRARPIISYRDITVHSWVNGGNFVGTAAIHESGDGLHGIHQVENVTALKRTVPLVFRSDMTGTFSVGDPGIPGTVYQNDFTYGLPYLGEG